MFKSAARGRESQHTVHPGSSGAATVLLSVLLAAVGGPLPIRVRCWDGSGAADPDAVATVVFVRSRGLRRLLWAPGELGLVRAYVSDDMHIEGDILAVLDLPDVIERVAHHQGIGLSSRQRLAAAVSAVRIGAVGPPPRPPAEEIRRRRGRLHSVGRDALSVSHHYDVGNEFYRLILGPSMVYSCAYWAQEPGPAYGLDEAQRDKCELVCTKLGLHPGMRLLDVGCGWGSPAVRAAAREGVSRQRAPAAAHVQKPHPGVQAELGAHQFALVSLGLIQAVARAALLRPVGAGVDHARTQDQPVELITDVVMVGNRLGITTDAVESAAAPTNFLRGRLHSIS